MIESLLENTEPRFHTSPAIRADLIKVCKNRPDLARHYCLGKSRQKRVLDAFVIGRGALNVSLLAGAHADEPVGPETLRLFIKKCSDLDEAAPELFQTFRFVIVPHINPDGEAANRHWIAKWPNCEAYLAHAMRELPGDDIEFGFPDMRPENRCVASFLRRQLTFAMHMSFHGMGFSEGVMLLIERHWRDRTEPLREKFASFAAEQNVPLHDHDRRGEKGFHYIGPGFATTPTSKEMRQHFVRQGEAEAAHLFHQNSMEFLRHFAGAPLCLVTEMPLFLIEASEAQKRPGVPAAYLAFKKQKPAMLARLMRGESIEAEKSEFGLTPLPLKTAIRLQLHALQLGVETIQATNLHQKTQRGSSA